MFNFAVKQGQWSAYYRMTLKISISKKGERNILALGRSEKAEKLFVCFSTEISAEVVTKWRRKGRITVGLEQVNAQLPLCLFFLSLVLGSSERKWFTWSKDFPISQLGSSYL